MSARRIPTHAALLVLLLTWPVVGWTQQAGTADEEAYWAFDKTAGIRQGQRIADWVFAHAFMPQR